MSKKIEAGRLIADPLLLGEQAIEDALARLTALDLALVAAQSEFKLLPGAFEALVGDTAKTRAALIAARRSQRRVHVGIIRIRADEGMGEIPFGCDRSCLPPFSASNGAGATPILTEGHSDDRGEGWLSSSASSSSLQGSASTLSGGAEHRSGLQA